MPSFRSRQYRPERLSSLPKPEDDVDSMEHTFHHAPGPKTGNSQSSSAFALGPSDGSLLGYFDLPSPPSTPHGPTNRLSFSSLDSLSSPTTTTPATTPSLARSRSGSSSSSGSSTGSASPPSTSTPRWPTLSQRIQRLPVRTRSRSTSSSATGPSSSSSSSPLSTSTLADVEMGGTRSAESSSSGVRPLVRPARRTPYYPPNASLNVDRARVYMNRGPHHMPNWTPLSSLPRHVQLRIEERMVQFTAI
ncbi:hypothetical protein VTK56DRAFT_6505 [Thermocarpiscus australiensis]